MRLCRHSHVRSDGLVIGFLVIMGFKPVISGRGVQICRSGLAMGSGVGEVRALLSERLQELMGSPGDRLRPYCLHPELCRKSQGYSGRHCPSSLSSQAWRRVVCLFECSQPGSMADSTCVFGNILIYRFHLQRFRQIRQKSEKKKKAKTQANKTMRGDPVVL